MNSKTGVLYVVATPIGNLGDMTLRAIEILQQVTLILAEDTRHVAPLLRHFDVKTAVRSFHEHNERKQIGSVFEVLQQGNDVALVSDAGTPLISDPGYLLVRELRKQQIAVTPIPGCCAAIAALSASGLPTDQFSFLGFAPVKAGPRERFIEQIANAKGTTIFYESSHRIAQTTAAMAELLPNNIEVVIGREITKKFEQFYAGSGQDVNQQITDSQHGERGEFVVMVNNPSPSNRSDEESRHLLALLLAELPLKTASRIVASWTGLNKNDVYQMGISLQEKSKK